MTRDEFLNIFESVRLATESLCQPLEIEDYVIQATLDVSPPKWHLAHTSWFFETFILKSNIPDYKPINPNFHYIFNSYYQSLGSAFPRPERGLLARPTVKEVYEYRKIITIETHAFIDRINEALFAQVRDALILGFQHEQQHQELLLMDIKYNFSINPMFPVYQTQSIHTEQYDTSFSWHEVAGGIAEIGYQGKRFCFDNELPVYRVIIEPFLIANRLVTNEEYLEFIQAGGYEDPRWWLSDGWDWCQSNRIKSPLYWHKQDNDWFIFSLQGLERIRAWEPVCHVSFYEADAYARWRGYRLPREEEWEYYVRQAQLNPHEGNFSESKRFHPTAHQKNSTGQFFGDLWEWTSSHYAPYPGFKTLPGSLGEYNGKFMNNQRVLRGGSCATPFAHNRTSYRNFFQPEKRWPFTGIRLAADNG